MDQDTEVKTLRTKVLDGLQTRHELAADIRCHWRTILRYEHQGLPVIKVGGRVFYNPAHVREWILSHERNQAAPTRGRPRKTFGSPRNFASCK